LGVLANNGATWPAAQSLRASSSVAATVDQAALGQALFLAKGCVMCHAHDAVKMQDGPFSMGDKQPPNLSRQKYAADYVRTWLKDPRAVKPETQMPNLGLKQDEIEALIAFLNATGK
jgi:cytochrome c2